MFIVTGKNNTIKINRISQNVDIMPLSSGVRPV